MNAHTALGLIWYRLERGESVDIKREILELLSQSKIKLRKDDGELIQINLSIPTSIELAFVIGLRYIKKDNTHTEDHFLCQKKAQAGTNFRAIQPYYRGQLELLLPEYCRTHKQTIFLPSSKALLGDLTIQVNTISFSEVKIRRNEIE